jgi:phosphoserine aminotransferase
MRVLEDSEPIEEVHKRIVERYELWNSFLEERESIRHLVDAKAVRSYTVVPVTASAEVIQSIKAAAKRKGILLGEGYGDWKPITFRIANFPALKKKEIKELMALWKNTELLKVTFLYLTIVNDALTKTKLCRAPNFD